MSDERRDLPLPRPQRVVARRDASLRQLEVTVLPAAEPATVGLIEVAAFPVEHPAEASSHALRVRCGGRTLAYSRDTVSSEGAYSGMALEL